MWKKMKGQINFEFLAAAALYLIVLGTIITVFSDTLPRYHGEAERENLNLEAHSLTNALLTEPGRHSGGTNWETDSSTVENIEAIGLAEDFLQLDRDKVESLSTVGGPDGGTVNYTTFVDVTEVDNQYRFNFVWKPTVHTTDSFIRGSPPDYIEEPRTDHYEDTDNQVYYGNVELEGTEHQFLVTAEDGTYDSVYYTNENEDWDFDRFGHVQEEEELPRGGFTVSSLQNREDEPGTLIVLSKNINSFGAAVETGTTTIRTERYAEMDGEPMRIEVLTW